MLRTTDGYNYIANNDDVYLYTGMTSVTGDQSNVGFVLVNMRTKDTKFYSVPGAEENSAMSSAKGKVQHLNYNATFPILLNIRDRPTYFLSLKDAAGLVKMYAFVDVQQYQIVGIGDTVNAAMANFESVLGGSEEAPSVSRLRGSCRRSCGGGGRQHAVLFPPGRRPTRSISRICPSPAACPSSARVTR